MKYTYQQMDSIVAMTFSTLCDNMNKHKESVIYLCDFSRKNHAHLVLLNVANIAASLHAAPIYIETNWLSFLLLKLKFRKRCKINRIRSNNIGETLEEENCLNIIDTVLEKTEISNRDIFYYVYDSYYTKKGKNNENLYS